MRAIAALSIGCLLTATGNGSAQAPPGPPVEFDVVSIKQNLSRPQSAFMRTLPDGSFSMSGLTIRSIIMAASPVPVREVEGLPGWADTDIYDIVAKAPAGATRAQGQDMLRAMLRDRLKVDGHVEERERDAFALVLARADGRLGPQMKPSELDCARPAEVPAALPQPGPLTLEQMQTRCGISLRPGTLASGGVTLDQLARSMPVGGRLVNNRTGLSGYFALTLTYARTRPLTPAPGAADDLPDVFTAVQEQLGLKLVPEKAVVPVFVIDRIERPTPD